ncbi:L-saccharopine oxidase like protein [Verticillium longisporum]|nr:L-saccharopine oxidase like protein [Verticillium longisporum]
MCWDATTKSHDFLITPHPHCANLFVATGGSFHGWKFLPVIGEYIVDMLFGRLAPEYADRWAWDPFPVAPFPPSSRTPSLPLRIPYAELVELVSLHAPLASTFPSVFSR